MFLLRNARMDDLGDLLKLSRETTSVNLPDRKPDLKKMLERSAQSFAGMWGHKSGHAQYVFVMEDVQKGRVIGTSKIFARHGTTKKPHLYFQVMYENVSSKTLKVKFRRKFYRLRADKRGYTEIGGLVLSPQYRQHSDQLGRQLSYIRFVFMKAHPDLFMRRVIAELLPPLHEGQSSLWDFYGYKLTRLPYRKADLLSFKDKEFILKLFPAADLYHDVLPKQVQSDIGRTGPGSNAAKKLLTRIGFCDAEQIDPFDGGPHYVAKRHRIKVYQQTVMHMFGGAKSFGSGGGRLVMSDNEGDVRALVTASRVHKGKMFLPKEAVRMLGVEEGQRLYTYAMRS